MVTKISSEMQIEEPKACSSTKFLKTFNTSGRFTVILHQKTARKHSAFDYELILFKSKLKELVQLIKEKNIIIEFSGDSFF